jgi:hypothetical protein
MCTWARTAARLGRACAVRACVCLGGRAGGWAGLSACASYEHVSRMKGAQWMSTSNSRAITRAHFASRPWPCHTQVRIPPPPHSRISRSHCNGDHGPRGCTDSADSSPRRSDYDEGTFARRKASRRRHLAGASIPPTFYSTPPRPAPPHVQLTACSAQDATCKMQRAR